MNRLQEVAVSDPQRFAALAAQTASALQSHAAQGPPAGAGMLNDLSARFAEVARTGQASALMQSASAVVPPSPPSGMPGAPSAAAMAALSAQIDAAFNLKPPPLGPWFPK